MNDAQTRIAQFQQMAEADPDNELGHFSLAKAYIDAGQYKDAITPLERVLELNADLSQAYSLLGKAHAETDDRDKAVDVLTRGFAVAETHGDRKPGEAMAALLRTLGAPVVEKETPAKAVTAAALPPNGQFECSRCGRPDRQLPKPPFRGPLGDRLCACVCQSCWEEWIPMGTKVINEMGLVLANPGAQETYDQFMTEVLQLDDD